MKRKEVYKNEKGQYHRVDGPAVVEGDKKIWCFNGRLHRICGPAYIGISRDWYINHKKIYPEHYIHVEIKDFIYET